MFTTGCAAQARGACLLCGKAPTVKSHLLPAAIGRDIRGDGPNFWVGSIGQDGRRIIQSESFDRFLCDQHEAALHDYEERTIAFCRSFELSPAERLRGAFVRDTIATEDLVRFATSVLWRFHMSSLPEARRVDIRTWEPVLRDVTFGGRIDRAPEVLVCAVTVEGIPVSRFAIPPAQTRVERRRVWTFVLSGIGFMVKIDDGPFSPKAKRAVINGRDHLWGLVKPLDRENLASMKAIAGHMQVPRPLS